ncbi:sensor histidine kinase [Niallia sp. 03133]|uniref:sensor histidine kinase n=1 Tax=Niallia sp. 03133 TaxID=3458060 RepID=UPI004044A244
MKMTTKMNLATTAWIFCVLLAVNAIVFFSFMNIVVKTEREELFQKADDMINAINITDPPTVVNEKLKSFLTSRIFIRILNSDSEIMNQVTNDKQLAAKIKGEFSKVAVAKRRTIAEEHSEEQVIIVRVPIESNGKVVQTLEMGERIVGLEIAKDVLLSILITCTILGAAFALFGGRWLSNFFMRPISNMINTMEDIEQSGILKRIVIQQDMKDELQKMAVTFNRMIEKLDENMEKQKQFISDASHELKTPLTVIKSSADFLRRRGLTNKEIAADAIQSIYSEATHIQKMTERFLDLANTEKGNELDLQSIDMIELCEEMTKQLNRAYKREIVLHYTKEPITASIDYLKIKQVIIILLDNAIKYSTEKIDVFLEENEKSTIIRVKDNGIGIPPYEIDHIFERFYRVDKARSREKGGTGLGLSIAKNIMKQHNGEIRVKSEEGIGTEVALFLPKNSREDAH